MDIINFTLTPGMYTLLLYAFVLPICYSAPSIPPSDVIVSGLTQSDISVQWSHPSQPNGIITSYTLYINYTNGSNVHAVTLMSAFTLHLLEGLDPNQMVGVSISATTGGGEGPSSAYMFGQTTG